MGRDYKFGDHGGAFMGGHFDMETELKDNKVLAAHFIHSILWLDYTGNKKSRLYWRRDMKPNDFIENNVSFLQACVDEYKKKRSYEITPWSITNGVNWFLISMNVMHGG